MNITLVEIDAIIVLITYLTLYNSCHWIVQFLKYVLFTTKINFKKGSLNIINFFIIMSSFILKKSEMKKLSSYLGL